DFLRACMRVRTGVGIEILEARLLDFLRSPRANAPVRVVRISRRVAVAGGRVRRRLRLGPVRVELVRLLTWGAALVVGRRSPWRSSWRSPWRSTGWLLSRLELRRHDRVLVARREDRLDVAGRVLD